MPFFNFCVFGRQWKFAFKVASKPHLVFEDKASIRFESGAYTKYVSISKGIATQSSDIRWGFEATFI
jgi:hypothetical protein